MKQNKTLPIVIASSFIILLVFLGSVYYLALLKNGSGSSIAQTPALKTNDITEENQNTTGSDNVKVYKNSQYGFELSYPAKGLDEQLKTTECGQTIMSKTSTYAHLKDLDDIVLDNLFVLRIFSWSKSINEYIQDQGASGLYNTTTISGSNADEAIKIEGLKEPGKIEGYPPLAYDQYIYKHNNKLFIFMGTQNPGERGCLPPSVVSPQQRNEIYHNWTLDKNFKFTK